MIRINLLTTERKGVEKRAAFQAGQKVTVACSAILIAAALLVGWRYWTIGKESANLDAELASAQTETARLHSIITQVQEFEQRRTQLQQRVALIEQLRTDQKGPVHMLDQISRSLPPLLWLTELKQSPNPDEVLVSGRCTSQTAVSDFVANLEASGYFKKSIEIVSSNSEPMTNPPGELIKFDLKAQFQQPGVAKTSTPGAPAQAAPGGPAGR